MRLRKQRSQPFRLCQSALHRQSNLCQNCRPRSHPPAPAYALPMRKRCRRPRRHRGLELCPLRALHKRQPAKPRLPRGTIDPNHHLKPRRRRQASYGLRKPPPPACPHSTAIPDLGRLLPIDGELRGPALKLKLGRGEVCPGTLFTGHDSFSPDPARQRIRRTHHRAKHKEPRIIP